MKGYCPLAKPLVSSQDRLSQERKCLEEKEGDLWDLNASLNQILDQPSTQLPQPHISCPGSEKRTAHRLRNSKHMEHPRQDPSSSAYVHLKK